MARASSYGYWLEPEGTRQAALERPMTSTCSLCGQSRTGPAREVIEWAAAHRADRHQHELTLTRKRLRRRFVREPSR